MNRLLLAIFMLLLSGVPALADGVFIAPPAYPVPPAIPAQRALVVHRDGMETLIVESTLDAKGQSFGWIVPVPAEPTKLEATTVGALDTLELVTRPRITHGWGSRARRALPSLIWVLLFVTISRLVLLKKGFNSRGITYVAVVAFVLVLLSFVLIPMHLGARLGGGPMGGITAASTARIGSYDVTVLQAENPAALNVWLTGNGFSALPAAGAPIVADYIREGWRFVAAKLAAEGDGLLVPHPLRVSFPAETPVYPMRLTALADSTVALRLFVLADGRASVPGLAADYCSRLDDLDGRRTPAHPALVGDVFEGAVLTRLLASVPPEGMAEDFAITLGPYEPHLPHYYSAEGATGAALVAGSTVWILVMLVLLFVPPHRFPWKTRLVWPFFAAGFLVTPVVATGALIYRQTLPQIEVIEHSGRSGRPLHAMEVMWDCTNYGKNIEDQTIEQVRAGIDAYFRSRQCVNPYFGRPVRWGDFPGDFLLIEDDRGLILRGFSVRGEPEDAEWRPQASGD